MCCTRLRTTYLHLGSWLTVSGISKLSPVLVILWPGLGVAVFWVPTSGQRRCGKTLKEGNPVSFHGCAANDPGRTVVEISLTETGDQVPKSA